MSVLTERQVDVATASAGAVRLLQVPRRWLLVRLSVLVDGRVQGVRDEAVRLAAHALAREIWPSPGRVTYATQSHDRAAATLRQMQAMRDAGPAGAGFLLSLPAEEALTAAAEQLAASPHGVLVVVTVGVDGHTFAARWS